MVQEQTQSEKKSLWDGWNAPPNLVTFLRIILVVVFLCLYVNAGPWGSRNMGMRWWAGVVFIIAASTDKIDGWMARKYNQVTELGKLLDPIADKLLILGTLIVAACFTELGNPVLGWIATALFCIREIGITIMRFFVIEEGGKVIAASQAGKYKTLTQCIGLGMLTLPVWSFAGLSHPLWLGLYQVLMYTLIYFALILCLYSGWEYLSNTFGWGKQKQA
ncbi:CDP-diacylglycerol--glycerol-3-phosphate 3-phosphatidyltransferase [Bifidobacterium dolichotidis]|uniref:CDP-diacylglycerol--glycerol-3-phosphate 3-phosphatidyltransferase n=1 Tax=Bifidobacterium dolichotidis TaxID=2306976 RepID=A0A430FSA4_9BIFI|nr:CDP-diacylglycerol--glycerol-3-phosphate 3-phosphatidyltransferase [Bifidobacterium dolichotidis]RSX55764.1 CDP-diacylglycerol--glycerol-3-phosphate 3-phosphatidyltransferase [Bifidobacterium dolichotidis]